MINYLMKFVNNLIKIFKYYSFGVFLMVIYFIFFFDVGNGLVNFSIYFVLFFVWFLLRNMMDIVFYDNN